MLWGCYDLDRNPPTYDFVTFLTRIEQERITRGEDTVGIEIMPGRVGGFRGDRLWPHGIEARRRTLDEIVVAMAKLLPSCTSLKVCDKRTQSPALFWGQYSIPFDFFVKAMAAGVRPLRPIQPIERRRIAARGRFDVLVTITLREAEHHPKRNSNVEQWEIAARVLAHKGCAIKIIRDYRIDPIPLADRAALYRSAACNLFVSNGPAWFCMALDAPTTVLRPATEGIGGLYGRANWRRLGVTDQIPGCPSYQRLVWQDDTAENIVGAVLNELDSSHSSGRDGHHSHAS